MRSDCPSVPTRGSRFVGLLSMIITSVLGSGAWEHERRGSRHAARKNNVMGRGARDRPTARVRLASGIGNLSQDCRAFCSRGRGHVAGSSMPGLVREKGKGDGLLGFRGKAELV